MTCQAPTCKKQATVAVSIGSIHLCLDHAEFYKNDFGQLKKKIIRNKARREKHEAFTDLGLIRVKGNLGGVYYE